MIPRRVRHALPQRIASRRRCSPAARRRGRRPPRRARGRTGTAPRPPRRRARGRPPRRRRHRRSTGAGNGADRVRRAGPDQVRGRGGARRPAALPRRRRRRSAREPRLIVIDPLIDANTGGQTISTAKMGDELEALAKKDFRSLRRDAADAQHARDQAAAADRHADAGDRRAQHRQAARRLPRLADADRPAHRQGRRQGARPGDGRLGEPRAAALLSRQPDLAQGQHDHRLHQLVPGQHQDRRPRPTPTTWRACRPPRSSTKRSSPTTTARCPSRTGSTRKRSRSPTRATCGC